VALLIVKDADDEAPAAVAAVNQKLGVLARRKP